MHRCIRRMLTRALRVLICWSGCWWCAFFRAWLRRGGRDDFADTAVCGDGGVWVGGSVHGRRRCAVADLTDNLIVSNSFCRTEDLGLLLVPSAPPTGNGGTNWTREKPNKSYCTHAHAAHLSRFFSTFHDPFHPLASSLFRLMPPPAAIHLRRACRF